MLSSSGFADDGGRASAGTTDMLTILASLAQINVITTAINLRWRAPKYTDGFSVLQYQAKAR